MLKVFPFKKLVKLLFSCSVSSGLLLYAAHDPDPERFTHDIEMFLTEDVSSVGTYDILCVGSSTVKHWKYRVEIDLAPFKVKSRGFGGSQLSDVNYFFEELIGINLPKAIILYEGDNDVAEGKSVEQIMEDYLSFARKVKLMDGGTRVYIVSVKPSVSRFDVWPKMVELNKTLANFCDLNQGFFYVDVASFILRPDGTPRLDVFEDDGLHLNDLGYEIWSMIIRSIVLPIEINYRSLEF